MNTDGIMESTEKSHRAPVFLFMFDPISGLLISATSEMDEKRPVRFDGRTFLSFKNKIDRL